MLSSDDGGTKRMKTKLTMLVCVAMFLMNGVCLASVRDDQIALGGVPIAATQDYVRSVYGEPSNIKKVSADMVVWQYGDSFDVRFRYMRINTSGYHVTGIRSERANGIATPDGITVGDSVDKMWDMLGEHDYVYPHKGFDVYEYYAEPYRKMSFFVQEGVVRIIVCSRSDEMSDKQ